jgi:hypothetical protein
MRYDDILESLLNEGAKTYGTPKKENRKGYAIAYGKDDFLAFANHVKKNYQIANHHKLIAEKLQLIEQRKITRLMISMPPRHGKSEEVSKLFPAWYKGRHPDHDVIVSSYAESLAKEFTGAQLDYIQSSEYQDIFPDVKLKKDSKAKVDFKTTQGGTTIGSGVGGGITGKGAHLAIIDDPIKNFEEARSETMRDIVDNWYQTTLLTRLEKDGIIILVMTRWHTDDLAGRILAREKKIEDGGLWDVLTLPAISSEGNALWPEKYEIKALRQIQSAMSPSHWEAIFQQNPVDEVEREFPKLHILNIPKGNKLSTALYLDPAFGGKCDAALCGGAILEDEHSEYNGHLFITFGKLWRSGIDKTYDNVKKYYERVDARILYFENNVAQVSMGPYLRDMGLRIEGFPNMNDKDLRIVTYIRPVLPYLHFTEDVDPEFIKQVELFSSGAKLKDAPDALAGLIKALDYRGPRKNKNILKRYDSFFSKMTRWGL